MKVAVIISTYNWPEALDICLHSLAEQSRLPDEIFIADDGSDSRTSDLLKDWGKKLNIIHAWQENDGFRAASSRNNAIRKVSSDYVLLLDGDMVMHQDFVRDHVKFAKKNCFVQGSRVLLSPAYTEEITKVPSGWKWDKASISEGVLGNKKNLVRNKLLSSLIGIVSDNSAKDTRTCNMAFWREDLEAVNGFDNAYVGWGREDSDLAYRLVNFGCNRRKLKHAAVALHMYHNEEDRSSLPENDKRLQFVVENKNIYRCQSGLVEDE